MTREIVFDTETTGFDYAKGDRLVEIGAVELINHMPTGVTFHQYINPERDVPEEVLLDRPALRRQPSEPPPLRGQALRDPR